MLLCSDSGEEPLLEPSSTLLSLLVALAHKYNLYQYGLTFIFHPCVNMTLRPALRRCRMLKASFGLRSTICRRCIQTLCVEQRRHHSSSGSFLKAQTMKGWSKHVPTSRQRRRFLATISEGKASKPDFGPMEEYDRRVDEGILRDDEHQRSQLLPPLIILFAHRRYSNHSKSAR